MCVTPAGTIARPQDLTHLDRGEWINAPVPGTVAQALMLAGRFDPLKPTPLGQADYWYRLSLPAAGRRRLKLHGLASIAEVWFGGVKLLCSTNMFISHELTLNLASDRRDVYLCFRSLDSYVRAAPPAGRARWRTRLIDMPALRTVRTTLLGHMPGWFPSIEPIGPWRAIDVTDPDGPLRIESYSLRSTLQGRDGSIALTLGLSAPIDNACHARLICGGHEAPLEQHGPCTFSTHLTLSDVKLWWPHTHGEPALYEVAVHLGEIALHVAYTGFRSIALETGPDGQGFSLSVNDVPIFARGACWSSAAPLTLHADEPSYRDYLLQAKAAGFNMIRVSGILTYEADYFYTLCDTLGLMVWQDFMFANFDYPSADASFIESVEAEAAQFLTHHAAGPSLTVLCGGSEIAQQASMNGLAHAQRAVELTADTLAKLSALHRPDVIYVSDSPSGGPLPFYPRAGISHYYGVGAYLRPLDDARRADVRFASECLAFANLPCDATLDALGTAVAHEPAWRHGVPRDPGASWNFEDVRDHYLRELYGQDAARLRSHDPSRYLELSRAVVAELVTETLSEWRRIGSRCSGALVWQLQDVVPGAGWGMIDAYRRPKSPWYAMQHVLQPQQILLTDEGLNGLDIHLLNDSPQALDVQVEIVALRDGKVPLARAHREVRVAAHGGLRLNSADLLERFFDFSYAYRFGPRAHNAVIASMYSASGSLLSQAFYFPERTQSGVFERGEIGLEAHTECCDGQWWLTIQSRCLARYVQISAADFLPQDNWFHLAPGTSARVKLLRHDAIARHPFAAVDAGLRQAEKNSIEVRAMNSNQTIRLRSMN